MAALGTQRALVSRATACGARSLLLVAAAVTVWSAVALGQPSALERHAAIYDPAHQRMLVFGGWEDSQLSSGTWQLSLGDAPQWEPVTPAGDLPSGRLGHSAVYDPARQRMIVFGGLGSAGVVNDVWELSLSSTPTWSQVLPSGTSPSPRRYHTAIYDPLRDRMLVFGGDNALGTWYNDVWSLWLTPTPRWEQMALDDTLPSLRSSHSAIYDPVRGRMLVFGGYPPSKDVWALSLGDTLEWNLLVPLGSLQDPHFGHSAVYDPVGDRMVVFGGTDNKQHFDDVWLLSLTSPPAWSLLTTTADSPSPRSYHSAVYDSAYRRMAVFGGSPNVSEPTWGLSLGPTMRWSPARPVIEVVPSELRPEAVTLGDTVAVALVVSNPGLQPLDVIELRAPVPGSISSPAPFQLLWSQAVAETLLLAPDSAGAVQDSVVIVSNDPRAPRAPVPLRLEVRGLEFETRVLGSPAEVPLGASFIVVVTPRSGVRIERGTLHYRAADGVSAFDSLSLTPLATDFIAAIPAAAVTEYGVEYYVEVENSGFVATAPHGAPDTLFAQPVAPAGSITAVPRPTSGSEFLAGRDVEVEVVLPAGAIVDSGAIHYRQGGEDAAETDTLSLAGILRRPVATIPARVVGPRGVEYWVEVRTLKSALRFPATGFAIIRAKVQSLAEPSEHPGGRYRLLTVPLDFGADFSGSLDALLTDQFGTYDPVRWRAYWYDPDSLRNLEFSAATAAAFRPEPGGAFWLISRRAHRVDTNPIEGLSTPTARECAIVLEPGWNLFGNPFDFSVAWSDVRRDASAVGDPIAFDPSLGTIGDYVDAAPSVLAPFEGYFVHSAQAETLWVPPRAAPPIPAARNEAVPSEREPASPSARAAPEDAGDLWRFRLRAWTDRAADGSNFFGVHSGAEAGFDPLDGPKPPQAPGPWVRVAFVHREWQERPGEYRRDLRGPGSEGETWEVEVRSGTPGEAVTLELSEVVSVAPALALRLLDREQGSGVDWLRPAGGASDTTGARLAADRSVLRHRIVSFGDQPYRLSILAGTEDYVGHAGQQPIAAPARLTLDQSAPNPVRLATRIRFGLPRAAAVSLEIYSVLGQRVAVPLDRVRLAPGYHAVVWDGSTSDGKRAPSGVYFLRLVTGADALTRRLVLVR